MDGKGKEGKGGGTGGGQETFSDCRVPVTERASVCIELVPPAYRCLCRCPHRGCMCERQREMEREKEREGGKERERERKRGREEEEEEEEDEEEEEEEERK